MRRNGDLKLATRFLVALALLFTAFAHQPLSARPLDPVTAASLTLPDGSIADICFGTDGVADQDHSGRHEKQAPFCDFCRLANATLLPEPPREHHPIRLLLDIEERAVFAAIFSANQHLRPHSRAPPLFV